MKKWLAIAVCLLLNVCSVGRVWAQHAAPRAHAVSVARAAAGYLGVGVAEIDEDRAKALKLKDEHGVEIKNVEDGSPAAKSGLREGDVILEFNGQRVEGVDQFIRMVRETPASRKVNLSVWRDNGSRTVTTAMGSRPMREWTSSFDIQIPEMPEIPFADVPVPPVAPLPPAARHFRLPDMPTGMLSWRNGSVGIEAEALNSQLADYFGVKAGVLVRSVAKSSPAEKSGLKAGDVVIRVNGANVSAPGDISSQLRGARNHSAQFVVMRNHREVSMDVKPSNAWQEESGEEL